MTQNTPFPSPAHIYTYIAKHVSTMLLILQYLFLVGEECLIAQRKTNKTSCKTKRMPKCTLNSHKPSPKTGYLISHSSGSVFHKKQSWVICDFGFCTSCDVIMLLEKVPLIPPILPMKGMKPKFTSSYRK